MANELSNSFLLPPRAVAKALLCRELHVRAQSVTVQAASKRRHKDVNELLVDIKITDKLPPSSKKQKVSDSIGNILAELSVL